MGESKLLIYIEGHFLIAIDLLKVQKVTLVLYCLFLITTKKDAQDKNKQINQIWGELLWAISTYKKLSLQKV